LTTVFAAAQRKAFGMPALDRIEAQIESRESTLGRWTVGRWQPRAESPLFGVVDHIWYFDGAMTYAKSRSIGRPRS
jgi:hypothetical protein